MVKYILLLLSIPLVIKAFSVEDSPYCSLRYKRLCMGKGPHIGCQFPEDAPGEACTNYTNLVFTSDIKRFVTGYINRRRQRVAAGNERVKGGAKLPAPKLMMYVKWDHELEFLAQRLANQCIFMHDACRATVKYPHAGQTVGEVRWRRSSDDDDLHLQRSISRVLDAWWGERRRVTPLQLTSPFRIHSGLREITWGHFSQLAVWTLQAVGCSAVRYFDDYCRLLLVCDFSHTNMLGQRTLPVGPRAECPAHTYRKPRSAYPLLCTPVEYPQIEEKFKDEGIYDDYETEKYETSTSSRRTTLTEYTRTTVTETSKQDTIVTRSTYYTPLLERERQTKETRLSDELFRTNRPKYIRLKENSITTPVFRMKTHFQNYGENTEDYIEETTSKASLDGNRHMFDSRFKHKRPGAKSLRNSKYVAFQKQLKATYAVSLDLDEEDMMQLYKDTGYSIKPAVVEK